MFFFCGSDMAIALGYELQVFRQMAQTPATARDLAYAHRTTTKITPQMAQKSKKKWKCLFFILIGMKQGIFK
jgi:hypothetical protein